MRNGRGLRRLGRLGASITFSTRSGKQYNIIHHRDMYQRSVFEEENEIDPSEQGERIGKVGSAMPNLPALCHI